MEDPVLVQRPSESNSLDSDFAVVSPQHQQYVQQFGNKGMPPPSLATASKADGDRLEQRADIIENLELRKKMEETITFYEKEKIDDIRTRINAMENLDDEIVSEIQRIEELEKNKEGVNELLIEAAKLATESIKETQKVAKNGQTTVKRAMEIIKIAFPLFLEVWEKSQEKIETDEEIDEQLQNFEVLRTEVAEAGLDIDKRVSKTKEFQQHIAKAIELGEKDMEKMILKHSSEKEKDRTGRCNENKAAIDTIVTSEIEDVDAWIVTCKEDKDNLSKFMKEQLTRQDTATAQYEKLKEKKEKDLELNKRQQAELKEKLKKLKEEEEKIDKEIVFQKQVQERSLKLNQETVEDINNRMDVLTEIQDKANIARKVVELMTVCGNTLINSSIEGEKEYLANLLSLEKHSKSRLRDAVAHNAVEIRIKNENSTQNMEDCRENMKVFKDKMEKAAKTQNKLNAAKSKKEYDEYKAEYKREKTIKESTQKEYEWLMEKLEHLESDLSMMKVTFQPLNDMYELRMQEIQDADHGSGSLSIDSDMSEDEEYDDAMS